jgi:hypothetical protein
MLIVKILTLLSVIFFITLFIGETMAIKNKYPKFTKWWRENWIGTEDKLDSRKQNKK